MALPLSVTCSGAVRGPWWSPVGTEGDTVSLSPALGQLQVGGSCTGVYCQQRQSAPGFMVHTGRLRGVGLSPRFIGTESAGPWGAQGGPQVGGGLGW